MGRSDGDDGGSPARNAGTVDLARLLARGRVEPAAPSVLLDGGYAFDSGWRSLDEHFIALLLAGAGRIEGETGSRILAPGNGFWLPAGTGHRFVLARGRHRLLRLRVRLTGLEPGWPGGGLRLRRDAWHLRPILEQVQTAVAMPWPGAEPVLRALLALCLDALDRMPPTPPTRGLGPAHLARLEAHLATRGDQRVEPAELARELALTPDWFARAFRRAYGQSPRTWLAEQRLRRAADLLSAGGSAAAVARRLGWRSYGRFAAAFARLHGLSPDRWRRQRGSGR